MSTASKITLAATTLGAIGIVISVHYAQQAERAVCCFLWRIACVVWMELTVRTNIVGQAMHMGVIRDMENQRLRKERQLDFDVQRALEKEYKKVQDVRDTSNEG